MNTCSLRLFGIFTFLFMLTGCEQPVVEKKETIRPAKLLLLGDKNSTSIRNFPGEVEATDQSLLAFRVSGQLDQFPIKAGQRVKQGQLLARLDPTDFQLQVDDRQASYDLAKVEYERFKKMLERKLVAVSTVDQRKARYLSAKSALDLAKQDLAYTRLKAPYPGTISKTLVENYENVQEKQVIAHLQSSNTITIRFQIPEILIPHLNAGTRKNYMPTITFESLPGQEYLAYYKEHSTEADPKTLSYEVKLEMEVPKGFKVYAGMTANIAVDMTKISSETTPDYQIPSSAVFSSDAQKANSLVRNIWKVDPKTNIVTMAEIKIGQVTSSGIEVFGGLAPGDVIVTAGVTNLREGMKVRPWERERGL